MKSTQPTQSSRPASLYQQYLPPVLQSNPVVERFLQAFEQVLSGHNLGSNVPDPAFRPLILQSQDPAQANGASTRVIGLEELIRHIHLYFNPDTNHTPEEFLPWLASWVALSLREDWDMATKRQFIRNIVPLYQKRGTKLGMEQILGQYLESQGFPPKKVIIYDQFEKYPNYFQVQLTLPFPDPNQYWRQTRIIKAIIDQEKPAHTYYALRILTPTMQITGQMYRFKLNQQDATEEVIRRTIEIKLKPLENAVAPQTANLIVTLRGMGAPKVQSRPSMRQLTLEQPLRYEITARKAIEGWEITLSFANQQSSNPQVGAVTEVTQLVQGLETPLYLVLNNISNARIEKEIKGKKVIQETGLKIQVSISGQPDEPRDLSLQRTLKLYEKDDNEKPILDSGTTQILTDTNPNDPAT